MNRKCLNSYFGIIVDIQNIVESKYAIKYGANALMLYDNIPVDIKNLNISTLQFNPNIIKDIINTINVPLIPRIRIGNITELNILLKMGITHFYEKNIIYTSNNSFLDKENYYNLIFINGSNQFMEIIDLYKKKTDIIKITGKNINDIISALQDIYNIISDLKKNENNSAYLKHKIGKYNLTIKIVKYIIKFEKLPIPLYISCITNSQDFELIIQQTHLLKIIDGIVIENSIFQLQDYENQLLNIMNLRDNIIS